ncbi:glycosyltransferase [Streptomyces cylindrosporus]|uniref:Glycosyltransferase n=1 Tax=Streptomyces cylindrosporus TaxID=2927583 RepID=A0ABS9YGQ7_9ACTN|nr:glycosyltransferase [Streptomyces cylindrosporus]MCI3276433.1 glycosyltransferase [Streptomyces cylindrosporus]
MKLSQLLGLLQVPGAVPTSRFASDLALIASVSPGLAAAPLPSTDAAGLAEAYASYRPRPVTAVVLTQDEEERIARCLTALAEDTDRCLLIDSGSADATVERALRARADARIRSAPWADDFSRQRNLAFDEVDEGWLWYVDADEVLAPEHSGRLRRALSVLDFLLGTRDFVVSPVIADQGGPAYTNTQRVLRADGPLRFRGRVHEHPYDAEGRAPERVQVDVRLDHTGYLPEVIERRGKRQLYVRLDQLARAEEPDNPKWVYYEVRDGLDRRTASETELRSAFRRLAEAAGDVVPPGPPGYRTERIVDSWSLLCELALRLGETDALLTYTALLSAAGRTVEATYYRTLFESSRLLGRLSTLVDTIASVEADEQLADRHLMGRLFELQATLALAGGRYEAVLPAYRKAVARSAGHGVKEDFTQLARVLAEAPDATS